jgi:hypothetical protein
MVRSRRRSVARVIGWGAALVLYAAGLLFSVELTSGVTAQPAAIEPATAVTVPAAQEAESPIATIALAATALVVVAVVRATRSARRRIPRLEHGRIGARVSSPTT